MIVVIPCWRRPELLGALLLSLAKAREAEDQRYVFVIDQRPDKRIFEAIGELGPKAEISTMIIKRADHAYEGPRYNILEGYRLGLELAARHNDPLIALLEEDVVVSEDIFEYFHDAAIWLDDERACINACKNQNLGQTAGERAVAQVLIHRGGPTIVYGHKSYQSMAVCHQATFVRDFIAHAEPAYYRDPIGYCAQVLPDVGLPDSAASQDGLIHRVLRGAHRMSIYPTEARAFHAGWYGYHRSLGSPTLPWQHWRESAEWIFASATGEQLNELADPRFQDIARCPLIRPRQALKLV